MLKGFRDFLMRGNVVDLAIAVVHRRRVRRGRGAFATDFIGGIIGAIGGIAGLRRRRRDRQRHEVVWGSTITALIQFAIVAAAIYFVVVVPMTKLDELRAKDDGVDTPAPSDEAKLLTEIRDLLPARAAPPSAGWSRPRAARRRARRSRPRRRRTTYTASSASLTTLRIERTVGRVDAREAARAERVRCAVAERDLDRPAWTK